MNCEALPQTLFPLGGVVKSYLKLTASTMIPTEADRVGNFDDYLVKSKKAASYLRLLNHSRSCKDSCGQSTCRHTYRLLQHTDECKPNGNYCCEIKGCCTTKRLLAHVSDCTARTLTQSGRALCLVCTLASKPANAHSGGEHSDAFLGQVGNDTNDHDTSIYRNRRKTYRPMNRSQSMVDTPETVKDNGLKNSMQALYRTPLTQLGKAISLSSSSLNPDGTISSTTSNSKLNEFIVPTMIPKRFRSNTLQHVQHLVVRTNIENRYSNNQQGELGGTSEFPREKWLCVGTISTKIPVGQL